MCLGLQPRPGHGSLPAKIASRALMPKENYGTSVDIYAFGMVLLELRRGVGCWLTGQSEGAGV